MKLDVVFTPAQSAQKIMEKDRALLEELSSRHTPILHFYEWEAPSFTYGYFCKPFSIIDPKGVKNLKIDCARRPTGGGVCFHFSDLAFSFLMPSTHPLFSKETLSNYFYVNQRVQVAIRQFVGSQTELISSSQEVSPLCTQFCYAKATKYDVLLLGKKVGGAAQRQTKKGYLHQGSIFLTPLCQEVLNTLLPGHPEVISAINETSYFLTPSSQHLEKERQRLKKCLLSAFIE